jgi:hypothetical protein
LYKQDYMRYLQNVLKIPVAYDDKRIDEILAEDANKKYITKADATSRDELTRIASSKHD